MTIDRESRDRIIGVIDRYLNDELTAFELDGILLDFRGETADETVHAAIDILWCFYDDCDDHRVVMDRTVWDYWQRLRLVLASDAGLRTETKRIWSVTQLVAAVALGWFVMLAIQMGFGEQLAIAAIPFGVVSIVISIYRQQLTADNITFDPFLSPFTSVWQLWEIRRAAAEFRKQRYRKDLQDRRIKRLVGEPVMSLHMYVHWLLHGPAVLVAQLFPVSVSRHRVVS